MNSQNQKLALPGIENLLARSLLGFKEISGTICAIYLITAFIGLGIYIAVLSTIEKLGFPDIISYISLVIFYTLLIFWMEVSIISAINEKLEPREAIIRGLQKLIPFSWISILLILIISGGLILGIVPGIIFYVWFSLAPFVLVSENVKGMDALFRSKQWVAGYWKDVFFRLLIITLIGGILFPLFLFIGKTGLFVLLFFSEFVLIFDFLIYQDLRMIKGQIPLEPVRKEERNKFILVAIIGVLVITGLTFGISTKKILLPAERKQKETLEELMRKLEESKIRLKEMEKESKIKNTLKNIKDTADRIYKEEKDYIGVNCEHPELTSFCNEIKNYTGKEPIIHSSKEEFCVYVKLSESYFCIDSQMSFVQRTTIFPGEKEYCNGTTFVCPATKERREREKEWRANWKIYRNEKYGFEFEYPAIYDTKEYQHCKLREKDETFYLGNNCLLKIEDIGDLSLSTYVVNWINEHYRDPKYWLWEIKSQDRYRRKERPGAKVSYVYVTGEYLDKREGWGTITFIQEDKKVFKFIYDIGLIGEGAKKCDFQLGDKFFSEYEIYDIMFDSFKFLE